MWNTIKNILQKNKNAYIIVVENGKPVMVINSFEEYHRLTEGRENKPLGERTAAKEENILEEINQEIANLQEPEQNLQVTEEAPKGIQAVDEIRVEDIPLL